MVIVMISLIFFGMMQVVMKINAEQIQQWSVFYGARARVVGMSNNEVEKRWRIFSTINSGKMLKPFTGLSSVAQVGYEPGLFDRYLRQPFNAYELSAQLDYEQWDDLPTLPASSFDVYQIQKDDVRQNYPLTIARLIPFLAADFGTNAVLGCDVSLENHFPLYLDTN